MAYNRAYFAGKTAAVTGGASGIGLALCEELLKSGARNVVLVDFNRETLAQHSGRLEKQYPGRVKGILCDVTHEEAVQEMIAQAAAFGGGRLDILINCAGLGMHGKFTEEPDGLDASIPFKSKVATNAEWKKAFAINFFGPVYGCRAAIPIMLAQGSGQIVNIISGIAFAPMAYQSMYAATKAALNTLTLALRGEYREYGIKFNSATPGTTATAIFDESAAGAPPEAQTPHQSAQRVLRGVADDDRLILGDDDDFGGAKNCFLPDGVGKMLDGIFLNFARQRRRGMLSFKAGEIPVEEVDAQVLALGAIAEMNMESPSLVTEKLSQYVAGRDAVHVDKAYFAGKTAAVTGGASGIGLGLCEELLACGAEKVVLADCNPDTLARQQARLESLYPGRVRGVLCNVANEAEVQAMIAASAGFFGGRFDLLINCAGIGQHGLTMAVPEQAEIRRTGMTTEAPERWDEIFSVNFYGALYGCRAILPVMLAQGGGQIVNIISGQAYAPMPYEAIYSAAKAALNAMTLVLRYEYWDDGILFNSATPGTTATAIFQGHAPSSAQSPTQSARRILMGVGQNDRLILGDDSDLTGAIICFNPHAGDLWDQYYLDAFEKARGLRMPR